VIKKILIESQKNSRRGTLGIRNWRDPRGKGLFRVLIKPKRLRKGGDVKNKGRKRPAKAIAKRGKKINSKAGGLKKEF